MPISTVKLAALVSGCSLEHQRLHRALCGPGYFTCDASAIETTEIVAIREAYTASRRLHLQEAQRGVSVGSWAHARPKAKPTRWCFTLAKGRARPSELLHPGVDDAIRALERCFAEIAAVLAVAIVRALGLHKMSLARASSSSLLRCLRYAPSSSPGELGIGPHVDFGDFTLCHSDHKGLEVEEHDSGSWETLPAGELHFLAATGLEEKAERRVRAVTHRVLAPAKERLSFCSFHGVPDEVWSPFNRKRRGRA